LREVNSEYFPDAPSKAFQALSSGPLKRPRDSLVRNFVIVLLKDVLTPTLEWKARLQVFAALSAVKQLHHRLFEITMEERLPSLLRALPDDALNWGIFVLTRFNDYWEILPQDVQLKIEAYAAALPEEHFMDIDDILKYGPLRRHAERRVRLASRKDIRECIFFEMPSIVADRCIALYLESKNFAQANEWASEMRMYANNFSAEQQRRILSGVRDNDQLRYANTVSSVISTLRQTKIIALAEFESILEANGLQQFMLDASEPAF
jgi:hypothetical protein